MIWVWTRCAHMAIACAPSMIEHMYVDLQAGCLRYDEGQPKLLMCKSTRMICVHCSATCNVLINSRSHSSLTELYHIKTHVRKPMILWTFGITHYRSYKVPPHSTTNTRGELVSRQHVYNELEGNIPIMPLCPFLGELYHFLVFVVPLARLSAEASRCTA